MSSTCAHKVSDKTWQEANVLGLCDLCELDMKGGMLFR